MYSTPLINIDEKKVKKTQKFAKKLKKVEKNMFLMYFTPILIMQNFLPSKNITFLL